MIPFLIFTFFRKYLMQGWIKFGILIAQFLKTHHRFILVNTVLLGTVFFPMNTIAQNPQLNYKVRFHGEDIGWLKLEKSTIGNKLNLQLTSEIKTKIIYPITVFSKETSTFENGKLVYSSSFRKTNGSTKLDKQTKLVGNSYEVTEDGEREQLSFPLIDNNLLSLYFEEPTNLKTVYCDKRSSFVNITKTSDGGYQMKFSNGNSNCFYYKNGICTRVKIEHLFYTAEIVFAQGER